MPSMPPGALRAARAGTAVLALALAVLAVAEQRRIAAGHARLLAFLAHSGPDANAPAPPELEREIAREPDLERGAAVAAWAVLAAELDPRRYAGLSARDE